MSGPAQLITDAAIDEVRAAHEERNAIRPGPKVSSAPCLLLCLFSLIFLFISLFVYLLFQPIVYVSKPNPPPPPPEEPKQPPRSPVYVAPPFGQR